MTAVTQEIRAVGIIGLGTMGRPMGGRLREAGYRVVGYDSVGEACRLAEDFGIGVCGSPREVAAQADLVLVLVGFDKQVDAVLFGDDGILRGARPGLVVGLGSTVAPTYARDLVGRVADRDVHLLDMPITRGEDAAHQGSLLVMAAGEPAVVEACTPALKTFATDIFDLGPFGAGQIGKMINNMILWACTAANVEGLRFGERLGVDRELMRSALVHSSAANFSLIERADDRPLTWAEKDMIIAQAEADALRESIPMAGLVKELVKAFKVERGYPTPQM